jgi:SNF2 family DNA or RNA helicase
MFCTHPWLVDQFTHVVSAIDCSVKLQRLFEIMEEIVSNNSKVLVFTSYQKSADLLSQELAARFGIHSDVIDGRTPVEERQTKVDHFTAVRISAALVLNPRAAGTGLNITAANHVIHYNLEWNPAVEDQASARAHRLGQKQTVTVHRFFYIDTVEDVIKDRMEHKDNSLKTPSLVQMESMLTWKTF